MAHRMTDQSVSNLKESQIQLFPADCFTLSVLTSKNNTHTMGQGIKVYISAFLKGFWRQKAPGTLADISRPNARSKEAMLVPGHLRIVAFSKAA